MLGDEMNTRNFPEIDPIHKSQNAPVPYPTGNAPYTKGQ